MAYVDPHYILGSRRLLWDVGILVSANHISNPKTHAVRIDVEAELNDKENDYNHLLPHDRLHLWKTFCGASAYRTHTGRLSLLSCLDCLKTAVSCLEFGQSEGLTFDQTVERYV